MPGQSSPTVVESIEKLPSGDDAAQGPTPERACRQRVKHLGGGSFEVAEGAAPEAPDVIPLPGRELTPVALLTLGFLAALGLVGAAALVARRRPGWRAALAIALALLPAAAGLWLASGALDELWSSLHQPAFCLPRQEMARVGMASARHLAGAGVVATVSLMLVALAVGYGGLRRGAGRWPLLLPLALLLGLSIKTGTLIGRWHRVEGSLQAPLAALRSAGAPQLASLANLPEPAALPDLPLVLVGADGALRYDDSRGQQPPGPLPPLLASSGRPSPAGDEPPAEMLLAVDERASFAAVRSALAPLLDKDLDFFRLVFRRPGGSSQAPADLRLLHLPLRPQPALPGSAPQDRPTLRPHVFLDADGAHVRFPFSPSLSGECRPGAAPTIARASGSLDVAALRRCAQAIKQASPDFKDDRRAWLLPSDGTPWSEAMAAADALREDDSGNPLFPEVGLGFEWQDPSVPGFPEARSPWSLLPLSSRESFGQAQPRGRALVTDETKVVSGQVEGFEGPISALRAEIRACYEGALSLSTKLQGKLVVAIILDDTGAVKQTLVTTLGALPPAVASCTKKAASGLRFDARSPKSIVRSTFVLSTI